MFQFKKMKGYLKSPGHCYKLDGDVTTIGRGSGKYGQAHIPLSDVHAEKFHARIEKYEENGCYILVDLNSAHGTYVNERRVQNVKVKLAAGDVIRFGRSGVPHEFSVQFYEDKTVNSRTSSATRRTPTPLIAQPSISEVKKVMKKNLLSAASSSGVGTEISFRPDTAPHSQHDESLGLGERAQSVPLNMKMTPMEDKTVLYHIPQTIYPSSQVANNTSEIKESVGDPW